MPIGEIFEQYETKLVIVLSLSTASIMAKPVMEFQVKGYKNLLNPKAIIDFENWCSGELSKIVIFINKVI